MRGGIFFFFCWENFKMNLPIGTWVYKEGEYVRAHLGIATLIPKEIQRLFQI